MRATKGGEPKWRDGGLLDNPQTNDGKRKLDSDGLPVAGDPENQLNNSVRAFGNVLEAGWFVDRVTFHGSTFAIDSRDYIIDFSLLVDAGLLQNVPESASPDNGGGSTKGSYIWYVKESGQVQSVLFFLPSNGEKFKLVDDPTTADIDESIFVDDPNTPDIDESLGKDGTVDTRGFQDGVYP